MIDRRVWSLCIPRLSAVHQMDPSVQALFLSASNTSGPHFYGHFNYFLLVTYSTIIVTLNHIHLWICDMFASGAPKPISLLSFKNIIIVFYRLYYSYRMLIV